MREKSMGHRHLSADAYLPLASLRQACFDFKMGVCIAVDTATCMTKQGELLKQCVVAIVLVTCLFAGQIDATEDNKEKILSQLAEACKSEECRALPEECEDLIVHTKSLAEAELMNAILDKTATWINFFPPKPLCAGTVLGAIYADADLMMSPHQSARFALQRGTQIKCSTEHPPRECFESPGSTSTVTGGRRSSDSTHPQDTNKLYSSACYYLWSSKHRGKFPDGDDFLKDDSEEWKEFMSFPHQEGLRYRAEPEWSKACKKGADESARANAMERAGLTQLSASEFWLNGKQVIPEYFSSIEANSEAVLSMRIGHSWSNIMLIPGASRLILLAVPTLFNAGNEPRVFELEMVKFEFEFPVKANIKKTKLSCKAGELSFPSVVEKSPCANRPLTYSDGGSSVNVGPLSKKCLSVIERGRSGKTPTLQDLLPSCLPELSPEPDVTPPIPLILVHTSAFEGARSQRASVELAEQNDLDHTSAFDGAKRRFPLVWGGALLVSAATYGAAYGRIWRDPFLGDGAYDSYRLVRNIGLTAYGTSLMLSVPTVLNATSCDKWLFRFGTVGAFLAKSVVCKLP